MKSIHYLRYGPCSVDTVQIARPGPAKWWELSWAEDKWRSLGRLSLVPLQMNLMEPDDAGAAVRRAIERSPGHLLVVWEVAEDGNIVWGMAMSDGDEFTTGVTAPPAWLKMPRTVWDRLLESEPPDELP